MVSARARGTIALVGALLTLGWPSVAAAQPSEHSAAIAAFEEGTRLVTHGDCADAVPKFQQSLAHEPSIGARMNLADCEERMGILPPAWQDFRAAERLATRNGDTRASSAGARAAAIEPKVLRVRVPSAPGLSVRVNGDPVAAEQLATGVFAVAPGSYRVEANAPHMKPFAHQVAGAAGDVRSLDLEPESATPAAPASVDLKPPTSSPMRTIAVIVGGVGVAALATGAVLGVLSIGKKNDLDREITTRCGGVATACDPAFRDEVTSAHDSAATMATLSTVAFVAGGALLATGAVLYLTAPAAKAGTSGARWRLSPAVGAGTLGAMLGGAW